MPGSLRNRLVQHQEQPPSNTWENISRRLDEEFSNADIRLSQRLDAYTAAPPAAAWPAIAAALDSPATDDFETPAPARAKVIPILFKRIAAAVILAAVLSAAAMYLFTGRQSSSQEAGSTAPQDLSQNDEHAGPAESPDEPAARNMNPGTPLTPATDDTPLLAAVTPAPRSRSQASPPAEPFTDFEAEASIPDQARPNALQTVAAVQPVEVQAPPIRDERGKLIMDMDLIHKPNDPYIIVTGPNGDQTKISTKFAHCLSYLNGNFAGSEINYEGREWKNRFQQWRDKLLSDASFIPSATNFFDIFELQDMVED